MGNTSSRPLLVVVSGAPCTGKSTLARAIAGEVHLPLVTKDDIKERLFDALGTGDRLWSQRLGVATYDLLYYIMETQLSVGRSLVVESNFKPEVSTPNFLHLREKYPFDLFQILCHTESDVLLERFRRRWLSGERHPGHVDDMMYPEFVRNGMGNYEALPLDGPVVTLDTTDLAAVDYAPVVAAINAALRSRAD